MARPWYERFFGEDYYRTDRHGDTTLEVDGLVHLLGPPRRAPVLDLACGYGRHSVRLAARGYRVVGLDLSAALLHRIPSSSARVDRVRGDMRAFPFGEAFAGVINLFTSFGYFDDETDNFRVLREVERVMRPDGRFICQVINRDFLVRAFVPHEIRREDRLLVLEERQFDPIRSRILITTTILDGDKQRRYRSTIRVYTFTELEMLLAAAGLRVQAVYGGFDLRPYDWETNQLVVVAEKPPYARMRRRVHPQNA
ncbi:MAG: class I SAM-dependent methyltransferase [Candidatus Latescibacteria bacterium]|nr:class I SAM-dependent methyltransferase [Candidatus Latescibacterota bacterium]